MSKVICIDCGHGGSDSGATGCGLLEKDVALIVGSIVKTDLENVGYTVVMTREVDKDVYGPYASATDELQARVNVSDNAGADILVSIHCNAFNSSAHGTETIYCEGSAKGLILANKVQAQLIGLGDLTDRGLKTEHVYVVRQSQAVAILTELAFIDEESDGAKLGDPVWQANFAHAIARGITDYFAGV